MEIRKKNSKNILPQNTKPGDSLKKENYPKRRAWLTGNVLFYAKINFDDEKYTTKLQKKTLRES